MNIIYFVIHDIGRHISPYGVPVDTPSLEAFSKRALRFSQAYCAAPPCSPSRGCAMSGQYSHRNGLMGLVNNGWSMPQSVKTVIDYYNAGGVLTAHAGFQHERMPEDGNRYAMELSREPQPKCRYAENVVDTAIRFLANRRDTGDRQPFYLNLGTQEPHASLWAPGGWIDRTPVYGIDEERRVHVPAHMPDNKQSRALLARFQGALRYVDCQFGRLMNAIESLGYEEDTMVIFTTDHGMVGTRAKGTVYDRGMETALMIQMPRRAFAGQTLGHLINNIDLAPTFLEACGLPVPSSMDGRSFWDLLRNRPGTTSYEPHSAIYTERNYHSRYDPVRSIRTQKFHFICNFDPEAKRYLLPDEIMKLSDIEFREGWPNDFIEHGKNEKIQELFERRPRYELYDVEKDPEEFTNLSLKSEFKERVADFSRQLEDWMRHTDDPILKGPIPDKACPWPDPLSR